MDMAAIDDEVLGGIAFVGETLGPLFTEDPLTGDAGELYDALAALDVPAAAQVWPFCDPSQVECELQALTQGADADRRELADEYRRLFVGPGPKAAPPWGSVYTDHDRVMFGATALELHDWLSEHGISVAARDNMPDDSIGRMLKLMAWIARMRPELLREYLEHHLLTWASYFLELMEREAQQPAFSALARLTALSLRGIQDTLELDVTEPRFYR